MLVERTAAPCGTDNQLRGPRGLVWLDGSLLVANQNVGQVVNGGINQYRADGTFQRAVVDATSPDAPVAPRGIVVWRHAPDGSGTRLFVASAAFDDQMTGDGVLREFKLDASGAWVKVRDLDGVSGGFHPRGVVVGPDGALYVSNSPTLLVSPNALGGQVLRYSWQTKANPPKWTVTAVITCTAGSGCKLNRPEGLVFGPDKRLYVTSFVDTGAQPCDKKDKKCDNYDRILVYKGARLDDDIPLDAPLSAQSRRTWAQALLFGPGGRLYVPITNTGEIRRYDVNSRRHAFDSPVGACSQDCGSDFGWYLTFGRTNPATLAYDER